MKEEIEKLVYRLRKDLYKLNDQEAELRKIGNDLAANYKNGRLCATGSILCDLVELLRSHGVEHFPCPSKEV